MTLAYQFSLLCTAFPLPPGAGRQEVSTRHIGACG